MSKDVIVHTRPKHFTLVDNEIFHRATYLTMPARYILLTALSLPKDWDFSMRGLIAFVNPRDDQGKSKPHYNQGREAMMKYIRELEQFGYLERKFVRDKNGRFIKKEWHFYETPLYDPQDVIARQQAEQRMTQEYIDKEIAFDHIETDDETEDFADLDGVNQDLDEDTSVPESDDDIAASVVIVDVPEHKTLEAPAPQIPAGFEALCQKSVKPVSKSAARLALAAYQRRLDQGYSPDQILDAYDRYISDYRMTNTEVRYVKQLHDWLDKANGFIWFVKRKQQHNPRPLTNEQKREQLKRELETNDPKFADLMSRYTLALSGLCKAKIQKIPDKQIRNLEISARQIGEQVNEYFENWFANFQQT